MSLIGFSEPIKLRSGLFLNSNYQAAKLMKKNGVTTKEKITEDKSLVLNKSDDEDNLPTTEEASEDNDETETTYNSELIFIETLKKSFAHKYNSVEELISMLKSHDDSRLDRLIDYLPTVKTVGYISSKALINILMRFILKLISPIKITDKVNKDKSHLKQCDQLRFYLQIFNFKPNTFVEESKSDKCGYNIIMLACENFENPYLLDLLVNELNGDINEVSRDGTRRTPLYIACKAGNLKDVIFLVRSKAEVNIGKFTPLGVALTEKHHEVVQYLLTLDHLDVCKYSGGADPFLLAAQYATTQNFLTIMTKKDVDPDILTTGNESALSIALSRGSKGVPDNDRDNIVRVLLKYSRFTVDCNLPANGETPLFIASRLDNLFALDALLEKGADCNFVVTRGTYKGHNVFSIAVYEGNFNIVERLIGICNLDFITPFCFQNSKNQHTLLNLTFSNPNAKKEDNKKQNLIFDLLQKRWIETHPQQVRTHINRLIKEENIDELRRWKKFILSKNSISPETGNAPLHTAAANGKTKTINCLVFDMGVPIDPQNNSGDTPLHVASRKKQSLTLSQLLNYGSLQNRENHIKETPWGIARFIKNEACVRVFVEHSFNMGLELPSAESVRAENDELLANILVELFTPDVEKAPEQPLVENLPPKPKKKPKKKKNRNKTALKEAVVNQGDTNVQLSTQDNGNVQNLTYLEHNTPLGDAIAVLESEINGIQELHNINEEEFTPPLPRLLSAAMDHPEINSELNSTEGDTTPPLPAEPSPETTHQDIETQNNSAEGDTTPPLPSEPSPEQIIPIESELNDISEEENSSYSEQPPSQDISPKEIQSPSQQHEDDSSGEDEDSEEEYGHSIPEDESQEETENESKEDQSEEDFLTASREDESEEESNNLPADDQSLEKVAILPSPPQSPLRSRSFFSHTIRPNPNDNTIFTPSSEPRYVDFNATLLSELKDAIENELRYILSDPAHVFVKASLQNLIDYYQRLKYFAIIEKISDDSPVLSFIRALRAHSLLYGLDINRNVKHWQLKAIKLFQSMLDRDGIFQLDYAQTNEFSAGY